MWIEALFHLGAKRKSNQESCCDGVVKEISMITTRQIDVNLEKGKLKHRQVTTKNVNAGVRVEPPKEPIKPRSVTTAALPDVADIAEKKKRDDIMAERKKAEVEEKAMREGENKIARIVVEAGEKIITKLVDEEGLKKLNMRHVFVEIDGEMQAVSRRELR